jgi:hypothetical protein
MADPEIVGGGIVPELALFSGGSTLMTRAQAIVSDSFDLDRLLVGSRDHYLANITDSALREDTAKRLTRLAGRVLDLATKERGSNRSFRLLGPIFKQLFNLSGHLNACKLPEYDCRFELRILNQTVISYFDSQRECLYSKQCASYGETLLNCYLDIYLRLTNDKTEKEINERPLFLTNESTGQPLELDIRFEEFRLAFEFQGDRHYTSVRQMDRDLLKAEKCRKRRIILIPVNICQLSHEALSVVILNTMKDDLGFHDVLMCRCAKQTAFRKIHGPGAARSRFARAVKSFYAANWIYREALTWLDEHAREYNLRMILAYPDSSSAIYEAPNRMSSPSLSVSELYSRLKYLYYTDRKRRRGIRGQSRWAEE